jgi:DNA-binding GntR family transcriptional regulator
MLRRSSLAEEIRVHLREQILSGELKSGERLTEQGVAKTMGTSPGPVREAFAALSQEGLLISLPHRGSFVSSSSEAETRIAYDIRALIEPYAAEVAIQRATEESEAVMAQALAGMRAAADAHDLAMHSKYDLQFHGVFYDLADSELLKTIWVGISSKIQQFMLLAAPQYVPDLHETAEQHAVILELFRKRDVEGLKAAILPHIGDLWGRMRAAENGSDLTGR